MELVRKGLQERRNLEASCLVADEEEADLSCIHAFIYSFLSNRSLVGSPIITVTHRSLQATSCPESVLSNSSGVLTLPLLICSSESGGTQSSIDTQYLSVSTLHKQMTEGIYKVIHSLS
jgi:hypothetical protein